MTRILGLTSVVLLALTSIASARCSVPRIRTLNSQTVDGHMITSSGAPCSIRMRGSLGPTYGAEIVARPTNGTATVDGQNRIVYRSRPGFVGSDSFTYARRGETIGGGTATRTVRVAVTVIR